MTASHRLLSFALLALLLTSAAAASSQRFAYFFNNSNAISNSEYKPVFDLGTLDAGKSLKITISLPNIASTSALTELITGDAATGLQLYYMDTTNSSSGSPVAPTAPAGGDYFFPRATGSRPVYEKIYVVTFPTNTTKSGTFKLGIDGTKILTRDEYANLHYINVEVAYFSGNGGFSVNNPSAVETLLKLTETLRNDILKVIYVAPSSPEFNFAIFPVTTTNFDTVVNPYKIKIYQIAVGNATDLSANSWSLKKLNSVRLNNGTETPFAAGTSVEEKAAKAGNTNITFRGSVANYRFFLNSGFYLVEYLKDTAVSKNGFMSWGTFQTDAYACPYNPDFGDFYGNFQGCTAAASSGGLPCASFDQITRTCSACIPGYTLQDGRCLANTQCPPRKYFRYGECLDVNVQCDTFDAFTGDCLTCKDPNFLLGNGTCTPKKVTCAANQWVSNFTCLNVSASCGTFNPSTGQCLTCVSNLFQLNADGTCTAIIVNCPQGKYAEGLECIAIPVECLQFDRTLKKCTGCIFGFFVENGVCKKVTCPPRQVPSRFGLFCVDISPLCSSFDPLTGDCLSCNIAGQVVRDGKCVQANSALAGCKAREQLGFGPCVGVEINCKTLNLVTGECDECDEGYFRDFTGRCAKKSTCGPSQWSVNGDCLGIPDNCARVDQNTGLCISCLGRDYRLQQGQCVFFKSCTGQQFLNAAGQCADVSPSCGTWNPSNGQCITCRNANTQPTSGVCCPEGQIFDGRVCVNAAALQKSFQSATGNACLTRHPSLNFCVRCPPGSSPDYTVPFACA